MRTGPFVSAFRAVVLKALRDSISGSVAPASLYVLADYVVADYVE